MERYDEARKTYKGILTSGVFGAIIGAVLLIILLYISALLISAEYIPESFDENLIIVSVFLGATVCAVTAVKRRGTGAMVTGLAAGLIYLVLIMVVSALIPQGRMLGDMTLKILICCITGGAFGGALCLNSKKKSRVRRR